MACGGRVYKGDTVTISVPFDVDDYSNLTITYTTIGGEKIVKTQEEVEIEDGFITYTFEPGELDLLPDGVIYYTIECEVNGVPNVDSTNTNLYLKTPAGYSGRTAEDIYQEGYEAGLEDCSGSTDCSSAVTEAYQSGYTEGYNQGQADCPECSGTSCNLEVGVLELEERVVGHWQIRPSSGYDGFLTVLVQDAGFGRGKYYEGFAAGQATCSGETPCDCSSAITEAYQSGYTAGQQDCSGSSCNLTETWIDLMDGDDFEGQGVDYYVSAITPNYDGWYKVHIQDKDYGQSKYDEGYAEGLSSQCDLVPLGVVVHAGDSGVIDNITPDSAAGFSSVSVDARDYGAYLYTSGYNAGLYDCSATTCNLRPFDYQIYPSWDGYLYFSASQVSLDGFSSVSIIDLGYGQKKYDDGYQAGYSSSPCRNLITFKVRNATNIVADLSLLSFSVNGVPVEDVGAIFQTEEIQNFNYTTLWISGYTQPTSITGVVIEIKGENISGNSFNYDWNLFTEINGAEYEAASRSQEFFDIIDDNNKSRRIIYTYTGITLYNEYSFEAGKDYGIEVGKPIGYNEGKDSVIKSLLTENDTDLVIGYYYTSARTMCLITGEYHGSNIDYDGNSAFVSMSVNGGSWQPVEKYLELPAGWSQVRFSGCTTLLLGAFSHRFTPSQQCDMDALKIVSLPTRVDGLSNTYTFHMNDGLRVIASSCGIMRGATKGADNINVVITHYTGNQRQFDYFPSNGVLFIPEGSTADWASILPNWTHIEMF